MIISYGNTTAENQPLFVDTRVGHCCINNATREPDCLALQTVYLFSLSRAPCICESIDDDLLFVRTVPLYLFCQHNSPLSFLLFSVLFLGLINIAVFIQDVDRETKSAFINLY